MLAPQQLRDAILAPGFLLRTQFHINAAPVSPTSPKATISCQAMPKKYPNYANSQQNLHAPRSNELFGTYSQLRDPVSKHRFARGRMRGKRRPIPGSRPRPQSLSRLRSSLEHRLATVLRWPAGAPAVILPAWLRKVLSVGRTG